MEWISVKEQLPKFKNEWGSCQWLAVRKGKIPTVELFITDGTHDGPILFHWENLMREIIFDVTHWQPLPSLPGGHT